ncbi:allophanate hydrolase [Ketobacter alkanivorans]|uniref:Allophanate hydrolase n=1 Tax=Ketobacter alkanivorans TaxID=1917421 RepID=A0A2K9LM31_9GAMM|nr:allophanate hydrolase [Ketobacter alkanivorans]AUM13419.1 allophanate hydrolase [Ketobacter alkanivorans]
MLDLSTVNMTITGLQQHYTNGDFTPASLLHSLREANAKFNETNPVWIHLLSEDELNLYLERINDAKPEDLPLFGIPFAIKDNIDLAGIPTTAACPDFAYIPPANAFVVQLLLDAGAIPLGKTNLDQFATGLVGVRSPKPWGPCRNALNPEYISGGSSSGSAVTVANGLVCFSLGTDTAGSGRVPASLNNIVGLKPSKGLFSTTGVVPACRSLDCLTVFALTVDDANTVFDVAARFDSSDAYARANTYENGKRYYSSQIEALTIGVPAPSQLDFFGNEEAKALFSDSISQLQALGTNIIEIDFDAFTSAARLLYEGPWVTERYLATQDIIESSPHSMLPVIHTIISSGNKSSAIDVFQAQYKLQEYAQAANLQLNKVDAILTPTNGSIYTVAEVLNDPIELNSKLGFYTNFMNLLDCSAVAIPSGFYQNGVGFGVTLFHRAFSDKRLLGLCSALQRANSLPLGATALAGAPFKQDLRSAPSHINVVVCGAHLQGLPLNWQLHERGATLVEKTQSAPHYKLYALAGGPPFRPGMMRCETGGQSIEVEVWRIPMEHLGTFVAEIPAPLGIGKVQLNDGRWESGFICEACGLDGAKDITQMGSWRRYIASLG